jgi:hypothetical protein
MKRKENKTRESDSVSDKSVIEEIKCPLSFDCISKNTLKQIKQAVESAILKDKEFVIVTDSPILLCVTHNECGYNNYKLAFWPANQEIGELVLKTLKYLYDQIDDEDFEDSPYWIDHVDIIVYLSDHKETGRDEVIFKYFNVTSKEQIGTFAHVDCSFKGVSKKNKISREDLNTFLYEQLCEGQI